MRRLRSKRGTAVLSAIAVLALAGGAYAYWTTGGSGSGTGSVAAGSGTITLTGTVTTALFPGGSSSVTYTAANPGATDLRVTTVTLSSIATDGAHSGCVMGDFSMAPVSENATVPAGATAFALPSSGTLVFANTALNQDACKGAPLTLTLASS